MDALLSEAIDAINYLQSEPVTTDEYVAYIQFVDKARENVDQKEAQLDYVKELYDTMEEFGFPIPTVDMANYLVTTQLIHRAHVTFTPPPVGMVFEIGYRVPFHQPTIGSGALPRAEGEANKQIQRPAPKGHHSVK